VTTLASRKQRIQSAVEELKAEILRAYPDATFAVTRGWDDPSETWLWVVVNIEDPSDMHDLVLDRLVDMQIEELPIHVLPTNRLPEHLRHRVLGKSIEPASTPAPERRRRQAVQRRHTI